MVNALIIQCPKCGEVNEAAVDTCNHCGSQFSPKLEQADLPSSRNQASEEVSDSILHKILMWLLLALALAIFFGLMASTLSWRGPLYLLAFVLPMAAVIVIGGALVQRATARKVASFWPGLARSTGLIYEPDDNSLLGTRYPSVRGEYRGRLLSISFAFQEINAGDISVSSAYPRFSLEVNNRANIWFTLRPKGLFVRASRIDAVSSGHEGFNRLFVIKGEPEDYVKRAIQQTVANGFRTLKYLHRNVSSIELKEKGLVCIHNFKPANADDLIALVNLLCDLAETAEKMGDVLANLDEGRN